MGQLMDDLRSKGLKITPQRLAIYQALHESRRHPSAEHIYKALEADHPAMSLATVYKTLDALKKVGLIQELNVGEDSYRYDSNAGSHPHIVCQQCRQVSDLKAIGLMDQLREELEKQSEFMIKSEQLYFYGICRTCQQSSSL